MGRQSRKSHISIETFRQAGATVVSLAKNPRDLRPAIDAITNKVAALHQPTGNQPTVLLYGEEHSTSSHTLLPLFAMSAMNKGGYEGKLSTGIEMPYNLPAQVMESLGHTADEIALHLGDDPHGQKAIKILARKIKFVNEAPITNMSYLQFCLARKISTCFSDSACDEENKYLDMDDPNNLDIITKMGIDTSEKIDALSPVGVLARNFSMQINIQSHIAQSGKPICTVRCGAAHVFGDLRMEFPYMGSLSFLFGVANVTCIPIISLNKALKPLRLAPEAIDLFRNAVVVTDMDEQKFSYNDMAREEAYIQDVFEQTGFLSRVVQ